jgi:hypothetical protein
VIQSWAQFWGSELSCTSSSPSTAHILTWGQHLFLLPSFIYLVMSTYSVPCTRVLRGT